MRAEGERSRYHLWFAGSLRKRPYGAQTRPCAITGAPDTPLLRENAFQRAAPGCIRLTPSAFLHRPKALCRRGIRVLLPFVTVIILQVKYSVFFPVCQSIFAKQRSEFPVFDLIECSMRVHHTHAVGTYDIDCPIFHIEIRQVLHGVVLVTLSDGTKRRILP